MSDAPRPHWVARSLMAAANGLWNLGHRTGRVDRGESWWPASGVHVLALLVHAATSDPPEE